MDKKVEKLYQLAIEVEKNFRNFYLAGGTAIMLKYNHRKSVDLDFFNEKSFSFSKLSSKIRDVFAIQKEERGEDNIDFYTEDVRLSFIFFPFKNIDPLENFKGLKKASDYDIFLNKIYTAGRRIEPKDPFDAGFLYKKHRWKKEKVESDFEKKFPDQSFKIYLGALLSFEDYPDLPEWVKEELMRLI